MAHILSILRHIEPIIEPYRFSFGMDIFDSFFMRQKSSLLVKKPFL